MSFPVVGRAIGLSVLFGVTGRAIAHDGDIGIRVSGGKIETVLATGEPPTQVFGTEIERVFAAEWAFNGSTNDVRIDEPGLASEAAALDGQTLGFNIRKALRVWDGTGFVATSFSAAVGSTDLGLLFIETPETDVVTAGHSILVAQTPLDFHYDWRLNGATVSSGFGVYLVELELTNPGGVLVTSDPVWVVYNYGETEEVHDAAVVYAVTNFVPTPGTGLMAMIGLVGVGGMGWRRRR